ncbi:MAG TPA: ATPase [Allosphingosinicella sp.]
MPQIEQLAATYGSQIFWLLVTFGLVYLIIGRGMARKVVDTVELRDRTVAEDLATAEAARAAADSAEEQWRAQENAAREQAKRKLAEARSAGAKASEQRLGAANAELDTKVSEAEARIAAAQQSALTEIGAVAADAAQDIVRRVAETEVDEAEARQAVEKVLHG